MSFEIIRTKNISFCFGVKRAVDSLYAYMESHPNEKLYTYGELIHNPQITEELDKRGVVVAESVDDVEPGSTVFIRAHGVPTAVIEALESKKVNIMDMTCPKVKKIHRIAEEAENIIIAGDIRHPEVVGIIGHTKNTFFIAKDIDELKKILHNIVRCDNSYILCSQTTFNESAFLQMADLVKEDARFTVYNTVCSATSERQREVEELAQNVDAMIIIGGKQSSNTKKLFDIASKHCAAYHIESFKELPTNLNVYKKIGLSTGASTSGKTIEEVIINMVNTNDETVVYGVEEEIDFASAIDASMKIIRNGQRVTGIVSAINGSEIQVDLGAKHSGFIPTEEFANDEEPVKVGDEIDAFVVKVNDAEGTALLSKARLDAIKGLEKITAAKESGEICKGKVTQVVKGGIIVIVNKMRVFVPQSLASLNKNDDLSSLVNTEVKLRIVEVEEGRRTRIIGSLRSVLKEEKDAAVKAVWDSIEEGQKITGVVKSLVAFGAFVDIGGVDGLIHISDLTWGKIKHPSEVVNVGDVVDVEVKAIDREAKRISLCYKKPEDNAWEILKNTYNVGDVIDVTVLKIQTYGAFVSVIPNIDGLIHISQLANRRVENVGEVLTVGQVVSAKIIDINYDTQRVSLSIRALLEEETAEEEAVEAETEEVAE